MDISLTGEKRKAYVRADIFVTLATLYKNDFHTIIKKFEKLISARNLKFSSKSIKKKTVKISDSRPKLSFGVRNRIVFYLFRYPEQLGVLLSHMNSNVQAQLAESAKKQRNKNMGAISGTASNHSKI